MERYGIGDILSMMTENVTNRISNLANGCMPPGSCQAAVYVCRVCAAIFTRRIPLFFDFGARCPNCGSRRVWNMINPMEEIVNEYPPSRLLRSLAKKRMEKGKMEDLKYV